MNLKDLLPFGKPKQLLVCETDGFSLRGAVVARSGDAVSVVHHAQTEHLDMGEALAELVRQLRADGWEGGRAILLSQAVFSGLVELPVMPKKPRPIAQMQELIRWEVESLLMQHNANMALGRLLVERGFMNEEQAQAVLDLQQGRPNPTVPLSVSDAHAMKPFGQIAEELGYVRHSQVNACKLAQEWLEGSDDVLDYEIGWSAQGAVPDVPGMYFWLVSCVDRDIMQRWATLFDELGLHLQGLYPLTGSSLPLLSPAAHAQVVMESHPLPNFVARVVDGHISEMHEYRDTGKTRLDACLESYHALNVNASETLWFADWLPDAGELSGELAAVLDIRPGQLSDPAMHASITPGMLGAARAAFGLRGSQLCAQARVGGPLPPPIQRLEVRGAILAAGLLVLMLAAESWIWVETSRISDKKAAVDAQWKSVDEAVKRINAEIEQVEKRKAELAQKQADQARLQALYDFYSQAIPERVALIRTMLGVLQSTVNDEVVINSIDELGKRVPVRAMPAVIEDPRVEVENFNVEAWAISEEAAQAFIQRMKQALRPWDMEVRDPVVESRTGPLNLDGFAVAMRLVKLKHKDEMEVAAK